MLEAYAAPKKFEERRAMRHDSTGQMIDFMRKALGISNTRLAALLGVSDRTLTEWRSKGVGDLRTKARRLVRLCDVVAKLQELAPQVPPLNVLEDGCLPVADDEEIGSITLLSYVNAYPEDKGWRPCVTAALDDYRAYQRAMAARAQGAAAGNV